MSDEMKRKLTSRKFWLAVCSFVAPLVVVFTGDKNAATNMTALIMSGASIIAYILGEGFVDSSSLDDCKDINNFVDEDVIVEDE